ncbi:unnamed protein product [Rotaria sordida]|uniref:Uncharacterized protein n=1 Tax=Rotaria sordida TaxID=392033 RepID=A0A820HSQ8_9BILA|nr:unnamed protein product [Rotaria sordida]
MDDQRYLYISDFEKHEVRRYQIGDKKGTIVAGGNGKGDGFNQLNASTYVFVDQQQTVYVSDWDNHRVMKWNKDAKEGIVVAGGQGTVIVGGNGQGAGANQFNWPLSLSFDGHGNLYVVDFWNARVQHFSIE